MLFFNKISDKIKIMTVISIAFSSSLFSINAMAEKNVADNIIDDIVLEDEDCVDAITWKKLRDSGSSSNFVNSCSVPFEDRDANVGNFGIMITKDEYDKYSHLYAKRGNNPELQRSSFQDEIYLFGLDITRMSTPFVIMLISLLPIILFSVLKENQDGERKKVSKIGLRVSAIFIIATIVLSTPFRVYSHYWLSVAANKVIYHYHNFEESFGYGESSFLENSFGAAASENNDKVVQALIQNTFEREVFERDALSQLMGSPEKFKNNNLAFFQNVDPTTAEFFELFYECASTNRAEIKISNEWNFTRIMDGLKLMSKVPDEITIKSGGTTKNYRCEPEYFGLETESLKIGFNFENLMINVFQADFEGDLTKDTSYYKEALALFDVSLGQGEKVVGLTTVAASNLNQRMDGFLMQLYAAVKKANKEGVDVRDTEEFKSVVEAMKSSYPDISAYGKSISVDETIALANINKEVFKMSLIGGLNHGRDKITKEEITGFQAVESFLRDTNQSIFAYNASKGSEESYRIRQVIQDNFNKSSHNMDYEDYDSNVVVGIDGFSHNYDAVYPEKNKGKRFVLKAIGDPDKRQEYYDDIVDRKLTLKTLLDAADIAMYQWVAENQSDFFSKKTAEIMKKVRVDRFNSVKNLQIDMMNIQASLQASIRSSSSLYDIYAKSWSYASPQTYYPYEARGLDANDIDNIERFDDSHSLKKYDLSMVFNSNYINRSQNISSNSSILDEIGVKDVVADLATLSSCKIKNSDGSCNMTPMQKIESDKEHVESAILKTAMAVATLEAGSQVCKIRDITKDNSNADFSFGSVLGKGMKLIGGVGCVAVDVADTVIKMPLVAVLSFLVFLYLLLMLAGMTPLLIGIKVAIKPTLIFITFSIIGIATFIGEFLMVIYNYIANELDPAQIDFPKTVAAFKKASFQMLFIPVDLVIFAMFMLTPFIYAPIFDLIATSFEGSPNNPFSVMAIGVIQIFALLLYTVYSNSYAPHAVEKAGYEILNLSSESMMNEKPDPSLIDGMVVSRIKQKSDQIVHGTVGKSINKPKSNLSNKLKDKIRGKTSKK